MEIYRGILVSRRLLSLVSRVKLQIYRYSIFFSYDIALLFKDLSDEFPLARKYIFL